MARTNALFSGAARPPGPDIRRQRVRGASRGPERPILQERFLKDASTRPRTHSVSGLGFRVWGVSVRGCPGAHPDLQEPWCSTLALTFTGLGFSRNRAPVFLFVLCTRLPCPGTCLDQAGARFGLALAAECLCLLRLSLDLSRLDRCQFGFGGGSRPLVFLRWCPDWMPPILNGPVYSRWVHPLGWVWLQAARALSLPPRRADKTGARFEFASGRWNCPDRRVSV